MRKASSHCLGFQFWRRYGVDTGSHLRDAGKHRIESGYIVLNRPIPGIGHGGFKKLKQTGLTVTHRAAKQRWLIPGHHRSSSDMNRKTTGQNRSKPA